ncbi:MAG: NADPH:quinone oxidoreductase family protein [Paracoccaceae bacterium]
MPRRPNLDRRIPVRAVIVLEKGSAPVLAEIPVPDPAPGEVRLRIRACGLNFADLLTMRGAYQERPPFPLVPGMEVSGEVDAWGSGVDGWVPGDRVAAVATSGGLAEFGCFPAARLVRLPAGMDFETAAAFQIAYGTSHLALARRAGLSPGETLLVTGAAGGAGLAAVEIGRLTGARVIAVARGAAKLSAARQAGADACLDSDEPDLAGRIRALGGADVAYETVGGALFRAALSSLRPEGRLLVIGFASGTVPEIPANHLLVKNVSVIGFWWGGYQSFAPAAVADSLATLFAWHAGGRLSPHIGHRLPLDRAAEGFALLRERAATGKVVVTI